MSIKSEKVNFVFTDKLPDLISKITDLTKISDIVKFKIDSENILIYSLIGETSIIVFKNYLLKTSDYFTFKDDFDYTLDYIIHNAKKFVKNLSFFKSGSDVKVTLTYRQSPTENLMYVRNMVCFDKKFRINSIGSEPYKIRDIDKFKLKKLLNVSNAEWDFQINSSDLIDIKKLSSINGDDKIITISTNKGCVHFGESSIWDMNVCDISENRPDIIFPKKYLSSINNKEDVINFTIFETFLLFKEDDTNFMVSFEHDYSEEEEE